MSTVTPEFLEQYHYILNLIQQNAAETKAAAEKSQAAAEKSREEWDRRMAERAAEDAKFQKSMQIGFAKLRKTQRKNEEANRIGFEELRKTQQKTEEGWEELRKTQRKNEEANRIGWEELRKSHQKIDDRMGLQEDRYGKFVESFVRNQLIRLLNERGIPVSHILRNVECPWSDGRKREFDAIAVNGDCIVVVEVKSTLNARDVDYFLEKMRGVRERFREYQDKKIIGAMAFIHTARGSEAQAQLAGFLTILATASSASITNPPTFIPTEF